MKRLYLFLSLLLPGVESSAQLLDSTFADNGYTVSNPIYTRANAGVVQPDGKVVVALENNINFPLDGLWLNTARLNTDGTRDQSYGTNGISRTWVGSEPMVKKVALQPDGKILFIGQATYCVELVCGLDNIIVGRLNANGTTDTTFGGQVSGSYGIAKANSLFGPLVRGSFGYDIAALPGGKILISGTASMELPDGTPKSFLVAARLLPNGDLDNSFGDNGKVMLPFDYYLEMKDMDLDQAGNIYLLGYFSPTQGYSGGYDGYVYKLLPDGNPDASFGNNGRINFDFDHYDRPTCFKIRSDGHMVIGGYSHEDQYDEDTAFITILTPSGQVSPQLPGGRTTISVPRPTARIHYLDLMPDNRIVFTGVMDSINYNSQYLFRLKEDGIVGRLNADGSPDTTFSGTGNYLTTYKLTNTTATFNHGTTLNWIGVLPTGQLLLIGHRNPLQQNSKQAVVVMRLSPHNSIVLDANAEVNLDAIAPVMYPNPTSGSGFLKYNVAKPTTVNIWLTELTGRTINKIASGEFRPIGQHTEPVEVPTELPSGIYLLHLQTSEGNHTVHRLVYQK